MYSLKTIVQFFGNKKSIKQNLRDLPSPLFFSQARPPLREFDKKATGPPYRVVCILIELIVYLNHYILNDTTAMISTFFTFTFTRLMCCVRQEVLDLVQLCSSFERNVKSNNLLKNLVYFLNSKCFSLNLIRIFPLICLIS